MHICSVAPAMQQQQQQQQYLRPAVPQQTGGGYVDYVVEEQVTRRNSQPPPDAMPGRKGSFAGSQQSSAAPYHTDPYGRRASSNAYDFAAPYGAYSSSPSSASQGYFTAPGGMQQQRPQTMLPSPTNPYPITGGAFLSPAMANVDEEEEVQVLDHNLMPIQSPPKEKMPAAMLNNGGSEVMLRDPVMTEVKATTPQEKPLPPVIDEFGIKLPE